MPASHTAVSVSALLLLLLLSPTLGPVQALNFMDEANNTAMEVGPGSSQQLMGNLPSRRTLRITDHKDIDKIYPYLSAYIQDPDAALRVEELIIDTATWPMGDYSIAIPAAPSPDEAAIHDLIKQYVRAIGLNPHITQQMIESLEWKFTRNDTDTDYQDYKTPKGYAAAATTILLSLCKNLTHLHAYGIEYAPFLRDFLLANNYHNLPSPSLHSLRHVRIEAYNPNDVREYDRAEFLHHFRYFGRLPSIESYTSNACMAYQVDLDISPPGTANVKKITITNADIGSLTLGAVIRVPRALEEFTFSAGGLSQPKGGSLPLLPKTLGKALLEHKETLRVVDLDISHRLFFSRHPEEEDGRYEDEEDWDEEYPDPRIDEHWLLDEASGSGKSAWLEDVPDTRVYGYTMASLHDFVKLERLSVPIVALLGPPRSSEGRSAPHTWREGVPTPPFRLVDGLPPGLRALRLYDYRRGEDVVWDEYVDELRETMAERFPLLVELEGVDKPFVGNSKYGDEAGYDEVRPPPEVMERRKRFQDVLGGRD
jgi:hypothetical protein